jgi:hypothetical protein
MSSASSWMPVFLVLEGPRRVSAELSADGSVRCHEVGRQGEDSWSRIGTAIPRPDGGFSIQLNAVPLNGVLVMRPPLPGEDLNPLMSTR